MPANSQLQFLSSVNREILTDFIKDQNQPAFRINQILDWIYRKRQINPDNMENLPKDLREQLKQNFICVSSKIEHICKSDDGTEKILIRLADGESIEAVIIPASDRLTFCLSTQVGCPVQCRFCASGIDGLIRNLAAGEIIEQFLLACDTAGKIPDNLVFMGIGEGLLNFNNLTRALELLSADDYFNFAARRITVSTSGLPDGIKKLADLERQWTLAVSLHAPDDLTRAKLIPDKLRSPVKDILAACDYYRRKSGRMVTFEYTLIAGINDSEIHAEKMAKIAFVHRAKVNLIPYNQVEYNDFKRPEEKIMRRFEAILRRKKVNVTLRIEKGSSVSAACGQLRRQSR